MKISEFSSIKNSRVLLQVLINDLVERSSDDFLKKKIGNILAEEFIKDVEAEDSDG